MSGTLANLLTKLPEALPLPPLFMKSVFPGFQRNSLKHKSPGKSYYRLNIK